ncbi:hypothetical protein K8Q94_03655 [Candidatus Nomurabacteria bacterium]|nr:hypothetical protein [Candidatus Nomurabacteria bacterium]
MKYNKGFAPVVVLLIVLGVLAVGGVAYFAGKSSTPKVADNSNYFPTTEQNYTPPTTNNNPSQQQTPPPANNPPQQQTPPPTPTCNPSITVLSPNGGEIYHVGQTVTVKWKSCNLSASTLLGITLSESVSSGAHTTSLPVVQNTSNDGSETFVLSSTIVDYFAGPNGYPFKISVSSYGPGGVNDWSDNSFTINTNQQANCSPNDPPSIKVLSPNGGETWTRGQQATVTWTSCNVPATTQLRIDLSASVSSGAHTTSAPIIQSTPNDGSETFTVSPTMWDYFPGPVGYPFKIYIVDSCAGSGCIAPNDYSDNSFSIN